MSNTYTTWTDEATGLRCALLLTDLGHYCGYVQSHKVSEHEFERLDVHGGITWEGPLGDPEIKGFWYEFDCAHSQDMPRLGGTHKDEAFVRRECAKLAAQLAPPRERSDV